MITKNALPVVAVLLGLPAFLIRAGELAAPTPNNQKKPTLVGEVYPGLASSSLTYAKLADLPAGVVLKSEGVSVSPKEVADQISQAPQEMRAQLEKNGFFLLENLATRRLLVTLAKAKTPEPDAVPSSDEKGLIQKYLQGLTAGVQVSEAEVAKFYEENKDACGGATLDQVKDQLKQIVLQQKQQSLVDEHIRTLGQRMPIEVSAAWTKEQSILAQDNPVDKARSSGKPSLIDFGSTGCRPCDMLAPILETIKAKYAGKMNVLFVHVGQEQILAARYGISSIPMQFFYDKDGREVFRHVGFWPQAEIEKKLTEMGVTQ
jgi:thiol-disulfide isomerase/thioredoxin